MNDFTFDLSHDLLDNLANLSFNDDFNSEINTLLEKTEKFEEKKNSSGERTRGNSCSPALIRTDSITGRPEEFYKTVKKKNLKGTTIVVGDYQLGDRLGKGAFGVVYKALDTKSGQFVAIKRVARDKMDTDQIAIEINFLKTFNHVNIVSYKGVVRTENHLNLVLEFVDSGSLSQVLAGYGFFPESLAAIYVSQVLDGLHYLHSKGVIHRDIKGGNILITRDGTIKLADFGIATTVNNNGSSEQQSLVEGSPYWMAPEIIEMSTATTASDIWSLGCTLIELLTGVPPYFEMTPVSAVYRMVKDEHPPFPEDISPNLLQFFEGCFQRDPKLRPTASQLRNYPWILEHAKPSLTPISADDMRNTIKKYTFGRENGYINNNSNNKHSLVSDIEWDPNLHFDTSKLSDSVKGMKGGLKDLKEVKDNNNNNVKETKNEGKLIKSGKDSTKKKSKEAREELSSSLPESESSDDTISDGSSSLRKKHKRGVSSLFGTRKKKDKKKAMEHTNSSDPSLFLINIHNVETKRSVFAYTAYKMKVMIGIKQYEIERTWSEFKDFHDKIKKEFPNLDLPECPQRKFWGVMEPDFIRTRWQELQIYCQDLLKVDQIRDSESFHEFLKPN